eukprot:12780518-Alexandrium_andersonii.AAC.1
MRVALVGGKCWQPWLCKQLLYSLVVRGHALLSRPGLQLRAFGVAVHQLRCSDKVRRPFSE